MVLKELQSIMPKIAKEYNIGITEIDGERDHIHFLMELSPQDRPSTLISVLKSKSTSYLLTRFKFPYFGKHSKTLWSSSFFITTCGGAPLSIIKKYISNHSP